MKQLLRIIYAQLLVCLTIGAFAQTTLTYSTAGTFTWSPPAGVTTITLQMWGAGGSGIWGSFSGGGGAFLQTTSIPVAYGTTYNIIVGSGLFYVGEASSFGPVGGSVIVSVQGGNTTSNAGGAASTGPYVEVSYPGGNGAFPADFFSSAGGGAGAGTCGPGANGSETGYGAGNCGGGSGGDASGAGVGGAPGGGGACIFGNNNTFGGTGKVLLMYNCNVGNTGQIGNGHTITYPPQMTPDNITSVIDPQLESGVSITWQQSTNNINFVTAKTPNTSTVYRFDLDSLQTTTYYRRGNNACLTPGTFGNWSDTVQIKVFTADNGSNGKITGYVQSRNGTAIAGRKVYARNLTPLKGRAVGFPDSAYTDDQGKFSIENIFYGDKNNGDSTSVRFNVYPDTTDKHLYDPASAILALTMSSPVYDIVKRFSDTTTFAVTGQVTQICYGCLNNQNKVDTITGTVDSVKIIGIGKKHSPSLKEIDSTYTGYRNPPKKYGSYGLIFQETDTYTITPTFKNHKIIPKDTTFYVGGNVSNINFTDTTTRTISGFFGAGCGDVIGTAVLEFYDSLPKGFNGKVRTSEFRKRVTTDANGNYSVRLPARAYNVKIISVTINDPIDPLTKASTVKSYFQALPASNLYRDITSSNKTLNLVYQREPSIAVSGLYDDSSRVATCPAFRNYNYWPQSVRRPVTFKVYQGPVSRGCLVDTGRVYVTTDISSTVGDYNYDTIKLKKGIGIDSIVAAQPNTVINPGTGTYSKKFTATFTDIIGRGVSTDTIKPAIPIIVVTGAAVDPNSTNFVTVSPQIPFVVLHDPPGNRSLSSWTQSVTSEQAISFKAEQQNSLGGFINVKVGLSQILGMFVEVPVEFWVSIDQNFSTTKTTTNTSESIITNTTEQTIVTADDPPSTGEGADLVYGAALNINYKLGTEIEWDSSACKILGPRLVMVTDIKNDTTSFLYTIGHITDELIPTLRQAANAQTRADSAAYFENQIHVWEQLVENNSENIKNAPVIQNISFSNGITSTYTHTLENSTSNTYDFNLEIDQDLAIATGFEIAGTGLEGGVNVGFKMTTGSSTTNTNKKSTTTSFTLKDDNGPGPHFSGDYFSVNIKKDPVYGTPMFETVAGGSMCPYVPGTIPLDNPVLTTNVNTLTGVKKDTATFTLYMNNLSLDATTNGARPYILFLNAATNPGGATVLIGGTSDPNGVNYVIPNNGGVQQVTVNVIRNTGSGVYTYDNLEFIMSDNCYESPVAEKFFNAPHQFSSIKLSADFASPVSGVNLVTPLNNWVANQASNDTIVVTFNGYDTSRLSSISVQYNMPGTSTWKTLKAYAKNKLGKTSTSYNWDITKMADGPYNLRLMVKDKTGNTIYSPVASGVIARVPPALFGTPKPANGVYTAGTQIAFSYTEIIVNTNLSSSMVKLRNMTTGKSVPVQLSAFSNKLIIVPAVDISTKTGHLFRVIVSGVSDLYGNIKTRPDTSYFTVYPSKFSTGSDALNVTTTPGSIYEDATGSIKVRFSRNSPVTGTTVVYYDLCGNAVFNKDYTVTYNKGQTTATGIDGAQGKIIIPKDSSGASLYIHPVNDSIVAPDKILTITLSAGGGYSIGSNYSVSDTILNHTTVAPVITADNSTTLCLGDSVVLSTKNKINGVQVSSYKWSTGAKSKSITVKQSGSYTVKVTDINGFTGYSAPTVVSITCASPAGLSAVVLNKNSAVLNWAAIDCAKKYVVQYKQVGQAAWFTDTVNTNTDTIKGLKANTQYRWQVASICQYPVIVISGYTAGTNFTTPASLTDITVTNTTDYKKAAAGDGFSASVYPNPASTIANLEVKGTKGPYNVIVMNLQGGVLWKAEELTGNQVQLPLSSFAAGTYMVIVFDKEHTGRLKLVKQ